MGNPLSKIPGSVWGELGKAVVRRITPGDSKKDLAAQLAAMTADRDHYRDQAAYWQGKAEALLDSALLRRNEIARPVFTPPPPIEQAVTSILGAAAAIGRPSATPQKDE